MAMEVSICNPLCRTPLSLIIDDSCPVINKAYYWIKQRHAWRERHRPDVPVSGWERQHDIVESMPSAIPADFAAEWGEWCGEQGIKGKFSLVPFPAGVGRIDRGFEGFPASELADWLRVARETIWSNFDLTPEMLTHTHVVDLKTWQLTEEWEQGEWVDPPADMLGDYITAAMELLSNVGISCEGVTSPGAFGKQKEEAYSRAVLEAAQRVNGDPRPFYFLHVTHDDLPDVPIWHVDEGGGTAIASIVACAGDWFGATGWSGSSADSFITEDLQGGRLPAVLEAQRPCVLIGHWPCFYANDRIGLGVLKKVKRRLDAYDPDGTKTIWMKNSEIGHYWMARTLSHVQTESAADGSKTVIQIDTKFPTADFTLSLDATASRVCVNCGDLRSVQSDRDFRSGSFRTDGRHTFVAFDLSEGRTTVEMCA